MKTLPFPHGVSHGFSPMETGGHALPTARLVALGFHGQGLHLPSPGGSPDDAWMEVDPLGEPGVFFWEIPILGDGRFNFPIVVHYTKKKHRCVF